MLRTPASLRLQIGIFGRTNVGKSTILNYFLGQYAAITSPVAGTTSDVVVRSMELLPVGPVLFLDTAGIGDGSELSEEREEKTWKALRRSDIAIVVVESGVWTDLDDRLLEKIKNTGLRTVILVNKIDIRMPDDDYLKRLGSFSDKVMLCSGIDDRSRNEFLVHFKQYLLDLMPDEFKTGEKMIDDLVKPLDHAVLVVPIDVQAPKGRIILPQVQTIRECLDSDCSVTVVKDDQYAGYLEKLKSNPDLVICDSQVVEKVVSATPEPIKCTTFSILASRFKGNLKDSIIGINAVENLTESSKILIAESCSHHPLETDIGRIQIPQLLKKYLGFMPIFDIYNGKDFPEDLQKYDLVIHCGACMINRREMEARILQCRNALVPVTNYGICISYLKGVLKRVISIFSGAEQYLHCVKCSVYSEKEANHVTEF